MDIKKKYANYILEKRHHKIKRDVKLTDFDNAKKVGIIWHIDDKEAFMHISEFLNQKHIIFNDLCYSETKNELNETSIGKKEINFLGFPKSRAADDFMKEKFDLLLNISVVENFTMHVLSALSNARFKIGSTTNFKNYFDLTIDVSKNKNSLYLIEQQLFYIEQLNKNNK